MQTPGLRPDRTVYVRQLGVPLTRRVDPGSCLGYTCAFRVLCVLVLGPVCILPDRSVHVCVWAFRVFRSAARVPVWWCASLCVCVGVPRAESYPSLVARGGLGSRVVDEPFEGPSRPRPFGPERDT